MISSPTETTPGPKLSRPISDVKARAFLGYVGDSGNAKGTPPHLHDGSYGVQGGALNPYPLLTAGASDRSLLTF